MLKAAVYLLFLCYSSSVSGCGTATHTAIAERSREFLALNSEGIFYRDLIDKHPDAFQAGAPYPDAYFPDICFDGKFHDVSEDTHWTPFINASVNYIRKHYPRPWKEEAEKLVVFLMSVVQHQVADISWHSLGIDQGFLSAMGNVNYHGSFGDAHSDGDFGGDVVNLFALNMDYIGRLDKWYVPTEDLLGIYEEMYGRSDMMHADVVENCTFILFLGRLGESIGVVDLLYPYYAAASPFLLEQLQNYYLGGMDDMATWSSRVMGHTVTMLDHGTNACNLPNNPIYIDCNAIPDQHSHGMRKKRSYPKHPKNPGIDEKFLKRTSSMVDPDDVIIERTEKGVFFKPNELLKRKLMPASHAKPEQLDYNVPDAVYDSSEPYSRLGESFILGDVNNDGHEDLIVGAPEFGELGQAQLGAVYIIYGSAQGLPIVNGTIEGLADKTYKGLAQNGKFGSALAIVDLNADGVNDLAVSAPTVGSDALLYNGVVYVFYGDVDLNVLEDTPSVVYICEEKYCNFGRSLAGGDLNGDGFADLTVGSPFSPGTDGSTNGEQRGTVRVLFAHSSRTRPRDGSPMNIAASSDEWEWTYIGTQNYDWTGFSLDVATTSDGNSWLAVGAPTHRICARENCQYDKADQQSVGKVLLFRAPLSESVTPSDILIGDQIFGQLGYAVKLGHFRDQDVLAISAVTAVSEYGIANNLTQAGAVYLHTLSLGSMSSHPWITFDGDRSFGRFGADIEFTDLEADGRQAVVISAPFRSETMLQNREGGKVFVFYSDMTEAHENAAEADLILSLVEERSRFGTVVRALNTQNEVQMVVSAPLNSRRARMAGKIAIHKL